MPEEAIISGAGKNGTHEFSPCHFRMGDGFHSLDPGLIIGQQAAVLHHIKGCLQLHLAQPKRRHAKLAQRLHRPSKCNRECNQLRL